MSGWTILALPGAILVWLAHIKGDTASAGALVSLVWIAGYFVSKLWS